MNIDPSLQRRGFLKCMTWAGTAMVWTVAGGVPRSRLIGSAEAATTDLTFVQISDSHLGFDKPANTERDGDAAGSAGRRRQAAEDSRPS